MEMDPFEVFNHYIFRATPAADAAVATEVEAAAGSRGPGRAGVVQGVGVPYAAGIGADAGAVGGAGGLTMTPAHQPGASSALPHVGGISGAAGTVAGGGSGSASGGGSGGSSSSGGGDGAGEEQELNKKAKKKRSRPNRYKNASAATLARRRAQNRQSQRLYRERKNARISELESQLAEVVRDGEALAAAYEQLQTQCASLHVDRARAAVAASAADLDPCLGDGALVGGVDEGGHPAITEQFSALGMDF